MVKYSLVLLGVLTTAGFSSDTPKDLGQQDVIYEKPEKPEKPERKERIREARLTPPSTTSKT